MLSTLVHHRSNRLELQTCRLIAAMTTRNFSSLPSLSDFTESASQITETVVPLIPTASEAVETTSNLGILGPAMTAIDSLHSFTGLPWWATIVTVGIGVRTAMLPVSLKGMKASAALFPLLRQARAEIMPPPPDDIAEKSEEEAPKPPEPPSAANYASIFRRFHELRIQHGAPHPFWILGSPLMQLPVFITAMASIRSMALQSWPGFSEGGTAWFTDLTLPAMDLATLSTPMGVSGSILPLAIAISMYANIDAAFGATEKAGQPPSTMLWVMGKVRLALEWAVVPLFVTALQLPQGALCYWATSSLYALTQNHVLKLPAARLMLGLPSRPGGAMPPQKKTPVADPAKAAATTSAADVIPEDVVEYFSKAAELRATGDFKGAAAVLEEILVRHPEQPRALFALGQVRSGLKDWGGASFAYLQAAKYETDPAQECRAWFGAGVALHMQGREDDAVEAFTRAAGEEAEEKLRVRAWVAGATLEEKLGRRENAVKLLKLAAKVEPKVEEIYLKPLIGSGSG